MEESPHPARPTPEDFLHLIARQNRGRLKVYLGSAAGVGKTYAMLAEGNRLRAQGIDVVIGYVEPHERPETAAQVRSLELVPTVPSPIPGGRPEMDLDAVLARKPTLALVDEFAHTNPPGSRHAKRYEDVAELLDAGINVITTVNIQHLESLYNIVESATGVKVRERIPDSVVAEADQIVNIDLPSEDLIERLKAGKIYPPEQAARALENFFTDANLTRLREIAFSEVANFLDRVQRRRVVANGGRSKPSSLARVMVAISSGGPHSETLLRKTARLASQLNAAWFVVYVRTSREAPNRIAAETHRRLTDTLEIAQKMGGTVVALKSDDIAAALGDFARERGITHAVMGRPGPRAWWQRLHPPLVERLAAQLQGVDLILG